MNIDKFKQDLEDYKQRLSTKFDEETVNLMIHAFCMGYCQLSTELNEEFGAYIELNPIFDEINRLNLLVKHRFK